MVKHIKGLPLIGNLLAYQADKVGFLKKLQRQHGDTFKVTIGNKTLTVVLSPDDVYHIMHTNMPNYPKKYNLDIFFGNGIFTSNGEQWQSARKMMTPFFKATYIHEQLSEIVSITKDYFDNLDINNEEVDIRRYNNKLAFDIILSILIGNDFLKHSEELIKSLESITNYLLGINYLNAISFFNNKAKKRYLKDEKFVNDIVFSAIDKCIKERRDQKYLLSFLLKTFNYQVDDKDRQFIRDQIVTLFFAGYETTSVSLSWIMTELANHPEAQEKVVAELSQLDLSSDESASQCVYTDMVIKECIRLYPPGWAWTRYALKDDQLSNHSVKQGEILLIVPYLNHRDERVWKDADVFNPDRFAKGQEEKVPKGSYLPFSIGPRACTGKILSMWEMRIILKEMLSRYHILPASNPAIIDPQTSLQSKNGFHIKLKKK
jgi:cytochrome P450